MKTLSVQSIIFMTVYFSVSSATAMFGYGMYGLMGMCPGGMLPGMGANSVQDEIDAVHSEIRHTRAELRSVSRRAADVAQRSAEYEDILSTLSVGDIAAKHMRTSRGCLKAYTTKEKKAKCKGSDCGKAAIPEKKYKAFLKICLSFGKVKVDICAKSPHPKCREAVANYKQTNGELIHLQDREMTLKADLDNLKDELRSLRGQRRQSRSSGLEAYCPQCMMMGNNLSSAGGNGLASLYMQSAMLSSVMSSMGGQNSSVAGAHPSLGFTSVPGINFGFPFSMDSQYGALPGAIGGNGFLCGPTLPNSNQQAAQRPQFGGAFGGIPVAFSQRQPPLVHGGGAYRPGFPPTGQAGPWGIGGRLPSRQVPGYGSMPHLNQPDLMARPVNSPGLGVPINLPRTGR